MITSTSSEPNLHVGFWYTNEDGLSLKVVGKGVRGVVVEYVDGSAELIDKQTWRDLEMERDAGLAGNRQVG